MKIRTLFIVLLSLDHVENVEAKWLALLESPILEFKQMLGPSLETLYWAIIEIFDKSADLIIDITNATREKPWIGSAVYLEVGILFAVNEKVRSYGTNYHSMLIYPVNLPYGFISMGRKQQQLCL